MSLNLWWSWLHFPSVQITSTHHRVQFMWPGGANLQQEQSTNWATSSSPSINWVMDSRFLPTGAPDKTKAQAVRILHSHMPSAPTCSRAQASEHQPSTGDWWEPRQDRSQLTFRALKMTPGCRGDLVVLFSSSCSRARRSPEKSVGGLYVLVPL